MHNTLQTLARFSLAVALAAACLMSVQPPGSFAQPGARKAENPQQSGLKVATFGTGCFWCTESDFDKLDGVVATTSGYMGGKTENPTYQQVTSGRTGHAEIVQVTYDPAKVTYDRLLTKFWHTVDPYTANRQFCDSGSQYRPVIFVHDDEQRKQAEASKAKLEQSGRLKYTIAVTIENASTFNKAEEYHQDFYKKNPGHYTYYRQGCGRDARLRLIWGEDANN